MDPIGQTLLYENEGLGIWLHTRLAKTISNESVNDFTNNNDSSLSRMINELQGTTWHPYVAITTPLGVSLSTWL